jgi:hypothetical protein
VHKFLTVLLGVVFFAATFVAPASAQTWDGIRPVDKATYLTFTAPVSLPGVILPAGTYLFRFADTKYSTDVLEVRSQDAKTVYAMIHTIPIVRTEAKANEVVTFREVPADAPPAIDAWFFNAPDAGGWQDVGCELVYSK